MSKGALFEGLRYSTVLLDLDHTLLDSNQSERLAFAKALGASGISDPDRHLETYQSINRRLWAGVEAGELLPDDVKVRRFSELVPLLGLSSSQSVDPVELAEQYAHGLGSEGDLFPGALEVVSALAEHCTLGLLTNGLSAVQRARVDRLGLEPYVDAVVISAEVGLAKPDPAIFELILEQLGQPDKESVLMVGDSLSSDIEGGHRAGIATCWYEPTGAGTAPEPGPTHRIASLDELLGVVTSSS